MNNIAELGKNTRFSKTNPPKNPGRKPSRLKKFLKDNHLGAQDISIILKTLITKTQEELKDLVANPKQSILITGAASALLKDRVKGSTLNLQWLIERAFGKAQEFIKHSGSIGIADMTEEERDKRINELLDKRNKKNDV